MGVSIDMSFCVTVLSSNSKHVSQQTWSKVFHTCGRQGLKQPKAMGHLRQFSSVFSIWFYKFVLDSSRQFSIWFYKFVLAAEFAFKICLVLVTWSPLGNNRAQTSQWSWVDDLNPEVFFEGGRD